jgi:hypothetical protein
VACQDGWMKISRLPRKEFRELYLKAQKDSAPQATQDDLKKKYEGARAHNNNTT